MRISHSLRSVLAPAVLAALVPLLLLACGGTHGTVTEVTEAPGMNTDYFVMPIQAADGTLPASVNDPGPAPLGQHDCDTPAGMDIVVMDDYEELIASQSYTYNDSTCEVMPVADKDWQPPSTLIPWGPRCGSTRAMHLAGTYTNYGAGFATVIANHAATLNPDPANPSVPTVDLTSQVYWPSDTLFVPTLKGVDLSAWDGITFWARRGPYGESGFRPGVLDRTTADDFNKQLPPEKAACRSIYTVCSCQNGKPCTPWDPATDASPDPANIPLSGCQSGFVAGVPDRAGTYCWDPKVDKWPSADPTIRCGQTACDYRSDTPVPTMIFNPTSDEAALLWQKDIGQGPGVGTIPCSPAPYVFHDSTQPSAQYCYRPGKDADPPEKMDRCQDAFLGSQPVDLDWKRYTVAFADMRQGNVDKRSPGMDKSMVEVLAFAFPGGNLDVWIDDVGFYRMTK